MTDTTNMPMTSRRARLTGTGGLVLLILAAVAVLEWLPVPEDTILWRELFNAGHAPLFAAIFIIFALLFMLWRSRHGRSLAIEYAVAWVVTVGIGAVTELLQIFGPRDADVGDFIRDVIGATAGLLLVHAVILHKRHRPRWKIPLALFMTGLVLILLAVMPAVLCVRAYIERALAFPQLAGCNSHWETWFFDEESARYRLVSAPENWPDVEQGRVAEVVFEPAEYAGFELVEPYPDWRGFSRLQLTIFNPDDTDLTAFIRVQDRLHNQEYNDRYNSTFRLHPGKNVVSFPLAEIVAAPAGRRMDLSRMSSQMIFLPQPAKPETLYIDDIRLR